jgi:hypothetical protein
VCGDVVVSPDAIRQPPTISVSADYRHQPKLIEPAADLALANAYLKGYDVRREEATIPDEVRDDAAEFLRAETAAQRLAIDGQLGFVILHLCGDSFYFLLVCTWSNDNELWETVYARDTRDGGPFQLVPQTAHKPVACVWELGVVVHERAGWTRHLCSQRDEAARLAYVADRYRGPA